MVDFKFQLNSWSLPFYFFGGCTLLWLPAWALLVSQCLLLCSSFAAPLPALHMAKLQVTDFPGEQRFMKQQELDLYKGNTDDTNIRFVSRKIPSLQSFCLQTLSTPDSLAQDFVQSPCMGSSASQHSICSGQNIKINLNCTLSNQEKLDV